MTPYPWRTPRTTPAALAALGRVHQAVKQSAAKETDR